MRSWIGLLLVAGATGCDPGWKAVDADGDGYAADVDCWDNPANTSTPERADGLPSGIVAADIHPGATEIWYDGIDQDCNGLSDFDKDLDGYDSVRFLDPGGTLGLDCYDDAEGDVNFANEVGLLPEQVNPAAEEQWYNGVDQDCSGGSDYDQDGDGQDSEWYGEGGDCFDAASDVEEGSFVNDAGMEPAEVFDGADDAPYDGTDADCSGNDDFDQDADGFVCAGPADDQGACDGDCDDTDPSMGAPSDEVWYDGIDQDCDGNDGDQDGDGFYAVDYPYPERLPEGFRGGDCNDDPAGEVALNGLPDVAGAAIHPGASETWYDGIDQDCVVTSDFDQDGDGAPSQYYLDSAGTPGTDCFDASTDAFDNPGGLAPAEVEPGGEDTPYDGTDADCAGDSDDDLDGDGDPWEGAGGTDCDDTDAARNGRAVESCGTLGVDDDCDGVADEAGATECSTFYADADGDGHGVVDSACLCVAEDTYSASTSDDCDDADAANHPGGVEVCDAADNDCDGEADDSLSFYYADADADTFGDASGIPTCDSAAVTNPTTDNTDCDDADAANQPGGVEVCDAADNDCDGEADEGLSLYYADADADTFGDAAGIPTCDSTAIANPTTDSADCDDADPWVYPGAEEWCDNVQNDCDAVGWTDAAEDGLVTELLADGGREAWDWSAYVSGSGTINLSGVDNHAVLNLCRGRWTVSIVAPTNVEFSVVGIHGANETVLDGAGALGTLLRIYDNSFVDVTGLTLTGGVGLTDTSGVTIGGAAVVNTNASGQGSSDSPNLLLTECLVYGNSADRGGAIAVGRAGNNNHYGYARLVDTQVYDNVATEVGGGAWVDLGAIECVATDPSIPAGFFDNTATSAGAAYIYGEAGSGVSDLYGVIVSDGCDWGVPGIDDNDPDDLLTGGDSTTTAQGSDASFTCTWSDCP